MRRGTARRAFAREWDRVVRWNGRRSEAPRGRHDRSRPRRAAWPRALSIDGFKQHTAVSTSLDKGGDRLDISASVQQPEVKVCSRPLADMENPCRFGTSLTLRLRHGICILLPIHLVGYWRSWRHNDDPRSNYQRPIGWPPSDSDGDCLRTSYSIDLFWYGYLLWIQSAASAARPSNGRPPRYRSGTVPVHWDFRAANQFDIQRPSRLAVRAHFPKECTVEVMQRPFTTHSCR